MGCFNIIISMLTPYVLFYSKTYSQDLILTWKNISFGMQRVIIKILFS